MRMKPAAAADDRPARLGLALATLALLFAWFWVVSAHRVHGEPWIGFAPTFVTGCGDFEHFYHGAKALLEGRDLYASGVHGYIYPPLVAFLYAPIAELPVRTAATLMLGINLAMAFACAWIAAAEALRRLDVPASFERIVVVAALATLLAATRLRSELQMWQTNVLMMLAMLLALRQLDARPGLAGLLLGLAANVKYLPLVFLPWLLLRRRYAAAAGFGLGFAGFLLLPGVLAGWQAELHYVAVALSGIAHLMGLPAPAPEAANVDPITIGHSISVTSGLARWLGPEASPALAMRLAGGVALAVLLVLGGLYRRARRPFLRWPDAVAQRAQPWAGLIGLEWAALTLLLLALSPQTNARHTSLLLMPFAPLAVLLLHPAAPGVRRVAALAAGVLLFGIAFPPNLSSTVDLLIWWRTVSGNGWCMLVAAPLLIAAGLRQLAAAGPADAHAADHARRSAEGPGRPGAATPGRTVAETEAS